MRACQPLGHADEQVEGPHVVQQRAQVLCCHPSPCSSPSRRTQITVEKELIQIERCIGSVCEKVWWQRFPGAWRPPWWIFQSIESSLIPWSEFGSLKRLPCRQQLSLAPTSWPGLLSGPDHSPSVGTFVWTWQTSHHKTDWH